MLIQSYLRSGKTLDDLKTELGIDSKVHPTDGRVILNYSQFASPKSDPHVHECRGLVLEHGSWDVVARAFPRFFNYGEMTDVTSNFNWGNFEATVKEDGSLMLLHHHNGQWKVNTRGSFADYPITTDGPRWDELFFSLMADSCESLDPDFTYAFEMCSVWNKVVRYYPKATLYLLGCFTKCGSEMSRADANAVAERMGVRRPEVFSFNDIHEIVSHLGKDDLDATFEGFVLRDNTGMRIKVKNARYVALHTLKGDGDNLFLTKNLLPFVLKGERDELLSYFPEVSDRYDEVHAAVMGHVDVMLRVWESAKHIESQKDFALTILPQSKLTAILFEARKHGFNPADKWRDYEDLLLKVIG